MSIPKPQLLRKSITDDDLETLIKGLKQYRKDGIKDPWVIHDGTKLIYIEPLDVLLELQNLRKIFFHEPT